jgi:hypothetical protein
MDQGLKNESGLTEPQTLAMQSIVSRYNAKAHVDPVMFSVLRRSQRWSQNLQLAFDLSRQLLCLAVAQVIALIPFIQSTQLTAMSRCSWYCIDGP